MAFVRKYAKSYSIITLAALLYAINFNVFFVPNHIAFGGLTGIAQMINYLVGYPPIGILLILMNVPLFLVAWRLLGAQMLIGSLYTMALSSALIDLTAGMIVLPGLEEPLLACIFGGVFLGISMGLICREGASFGGTDIASRLIRLRFPTISIGTVLMALDLVVIIAVAFVYGELNSALLGILSLAVYTAVMDRVLLGTDQSKVAYIISDASAEIAAMIHDELIRGVTVLHGSGAYTGMEKNVLLCAFRGRQIVTLKQRIQEIDPNAFLIVCNAYEVLGVGFVQNEAPKKKK